MSIEEYEPPNGAFEPVRERINVSVGALVQRDATIFRIVQVLDFETLIGIAVDTGKSAALRIGDLRVLSRTADYAPSAPQDLADIADEDWRISIALAYFHGLPRNASAGLVDEKILFLGTEGFSITVDAKQYWVPHWDIQASSELRALEGRDLYKNTKNTGVTS